MSGDDDVLSAGESGAFELQRSVECIAASRADAPVVLTCEHGGDALPVGWQWHHDDAWIRETHWAYDIGAAQLTREAAETFGAAAVLARFSRLFIDPNREIGSSSLIRSRAEGRSVSLNQGLSEPCRAARAAYWQHYHERAGETVGRVQASVVLAVHSYTSDYQGQRRGFEVGVLFDREEALGQRVADSLKQAAFEVRLNEPYSGRDGMMYSAARHAAASDKRALEIEVRQDRVVDPAFRRRLLEALVACSW